MKQWHGSEGAECKLQVPPYIFMDTPTPTQLFSIRSRTKLSWALRHGYVFIKVSPAVRVLETMPDTGQEKMHMPYICISAAD